MLASLFTRIGTTASDADEYEALGPDPEWDELIAWAGITPGPAVGAPAAEESVSAAGPMDAAASEEPEDWDAVIARAKASAPGPTAEPIDEISTMRARQESLAARSTPHAQDLGEDAWQIALRRAKQM